MGFSSLDDIILETTTNSKFLRADWNKQTGASAYTAGRWYDFSNLAGTPVANAWAGTSLAWTTCNESTGNGTQIFGLANGGNVSTDTKHLMNISAVTPSSTGVPGQLMLVDLQGYWPGISINSASAQTLTGTPALRYTNGAGCRLYFVVTTASGATAHNLSLSYTNQAGTTGRSLGATVACTVSAIVGHVNHSGTAANNFGPFLPLAGGDSGVQNVASVTFSTASGAGVGALCLARPLAVIPLTTTGVTSERDLLSQLPSLPRVMDGACLTWIYFSGAATAASSAFNGHIDFAWG